MSDGSILVLDSSVVVKWIKPERGRNEALALLEGHRDGTARIVVAANFLREVVAVAVRRGGPTLGRKAWSNLAAAQLRFNGVRLIAPGRA